MRRERLEKGGDDDSTEGQWHFQLFDGFVHSQPVGCCRTWNSDTDLEGSILEQVDKMYFINVLCGVGPEFSSNRVGAGASGLQQSDVLHSIVNTLKWKHYER